ncbi:MAG TPA: NHL repeat-containing protein [Bacteroidota bacterium]
MIVRAAILFFLVALPGDKPLPVTGDNLDIDISGAFYVLDGHASTITKISPEGKILARIGGPGWDNDRFDQPSGIWARNGLDIFVADYGNHRIQRFDRDLSFVSSFSTRESENANERFGYPADVALSRLGELYICDTENVRVIKVDRRNRVELSFGGVDAGKGRLTSPRKLAIGPGDHLFVLDDAIVREFDAFGNYLRDLIPREFLSPISLFGDEEALVVCDRDSLRFYVGRGSQSFFLDELLGNERRVVRDFSISKGSVFFLTETGVTAVPDPRR